MLSGLSRFRNIYWVVRRYPEILVFATIVISIAVYTAIVVLNPYTPMFIGYVLAGITVFSMFVFGFAPLSLMISVIASLAALVLSGRVSTAPDYFVALSILSALSILMLRPVELQSPRITGLRIAARRILLGARIPRTPGEMRLSLYASLPSIISLAISAVFLALGNIAAIISAIYSIIAFLALYMGIGSRATYMIREKPGSIAVTFVIRYEFLLRILERIVPKISDLSERAGKLIDERIWAAKFIMIYFLLLITTPSVSSIVYAITRNEMLALIAAIVTVLTSYMFLKLPEFILRIEISRRSSEVEREFPFFVAYLVIMVSGGVSLLDAIEGLRFEKAGYVSTRAREVFKRFYKEAEFLIKLRYVYGLTRNAALARYADKHPNQDLKFLINGYMGQLAAGGNPVLYLVGVLNESIKILQTKIELLGRRLQTIIMTIVMGIGFPIMVAIIGTLINPDISAPLLYALDLAIIPSMAMLMLTFARPMRDYGRVRQRRIATPIAAVSALMAGIYSGVGVINTILLVLIAIGITNYIEFRLSVRSTEILEENLKLIFSYLRELRNSYSLQKSIEVLSEMNIPREVKSVFIRMNNMLKNNIRISGQPWYSTSKLWRIAQFFLGKIEETGGGTPALFSSLVDFFSSYITLTKTYRMEIRIYEYIIYAIIALTGVIYSITLRLIGGLSSIAASIPPTALQQIPSTIAQIIVTGSSEAVTSAIMFTIIELAVVLGIVAGKIIDYSIWSTRIMAIASIAAMIAINVMPAMMAQLFRF